MDRAIEGAGSVRTSATREVVRAALLDPECLRRIIPGAQTVDRLAPDRFGATIRFGVGPFRTVYTVALTIANPADPFVFEITGSSVGGLGHGRAAGQVTLAAHTRSGTAIAWRYAGVIGGPVSMAGRGLLTLASQRFCAGVFDRLIRAIG